MKLYYIANARMPTEKAHGIQVAKMCEAFVEERIDLTLVVPRRVTEPQSIEEYYGLRVPIKLVKLPVLDWYTGGRLGYFLSSFSFMVSYLIFLWKRKRKGEKFILYTVDMDNYSSSALTLLGIPLFSEMHGSKPPTLPQRMLFRRAKGIIPINKIIVAELQSHFPNSSAKYIVEPNGVDLSKFSTKHNKKDAREQLGLPVDVPIVLYAGRFFGWKGLEILPQAASITPLVRWQTVGGGQADFERLVKQSLPKNLFFAGSRPHSEMSLWFSAADALLVLGTARDVQSYRYTSPMKLFEYLATGRPIVASSTPAIHEIVSEKEVLFYLPDDAENLAQVVRYAVSNDEKLLPLTEAAMRQATRSSWSARAKRIVKFMGENTNSNIYA
ncbi:MAG: glycosyltransferase family 4 protein [Candidatus Paceibacterota bacterium]